MNDGTATRRRRQLRIGVVCLSSVGGSGVVACDVAAAMASRGHRCHVVSDRLPERLDDGVEGVTFHGFDGPPAARSPTNALSPPDAPYMLPLAQCLAGVAREHALDLVHVHYAMPHAVGAWLAQRSLATVGQPLPIVLTLHGTDVTAVGSDAFQRAGVRFSVESADAVTTPSQWLADEAQRQVGAGGRAEVISNFVDPLVFKPRAPHDDARVARQKGPLAQLFLAQDRPLIQDEAVIMHVSNFRPVKRTPLLAKIFAQLTASTRSRLVLIGDGPDRQATMDYLAARGVSDKVLWFGKRRHFADLLADADVFVLPSESESFGLAALEALSCGVPVVASHRGGLSEVVQDGVTGRLVEDLTLNTNDTVNAYCHALQTLLAAPPGERATMRQAARQDVLKRFQAKPSVDRFEALYQRVLSERAQFLSTPLVHAQRR